jgi:hypothetical protein
MAEHKVVEWIAYDDIGDRPDSVGGMGGWFGWERHDTWQDFLDAFSEEKHGYFEAIRESVIERGHWIDGGRHQQCDEGVPLFEDGTVGSFSFRAWGDLMAAIKESVDHQRHDYMEFYYS